MLGFVPQPPPPLCCRSVTWHSEKDARFPSHPNRWLPVSIPPAPFAGLNPRTLDAPRSLTSPPRSCLHLGLPNGHPVHVASPTPFCPVSPAGQTLRSAPPWGPGQARRGGRAQQTRVERAVSQRKRSGFGEVGGGVWSRPGSLGPRPTSPPPPAFSSPAKRGQSALVSVFPLAGGTPAGVFK